jgi:hypothetical protein
MKIGDLVYTYDYIVNDPYQYYNPNNNYKIFGIILDIGRKWDDDDCIDVPLQFFRIFWSNGKIIWNRQYDFMKLSSF